MQVFLLARRIEAWRFLRLSFGWGPDFEMRCLLRRLKRLGQRHGLMELPEAGKQKQAVYGPERYRKPPPITARLPLSCRGRPSHFGGFTEVAPSSPASTPSSPGTACEGYPPSSPPQSPVQAAKGLGHRKAADVEEHS